jgi:hypothetical protein
MTPSSPLIKRNAASCLLEYLTDTFLMLNDLTSNLHRKGSNVLAIGDKWSPFTANFRYGKDE